MPRRQQQRRECMGFTAAERDYVFREWDPADYEISDYDLTLGPWK
jgi:hypothetical protein